MYVNKYIYRYGIIYIIIFIKYLNIIKLIPRNNNDK